MTCKINKFGMSTNNVNIFNYRVQSDVHTQISLLEINGKFDT